MQESHAILVVEFTGPSVSDGTLCTDRLAPSLLALSDALRFLNRLVNPENRGIYTQSDSPKKSSRNIWSLAVVSVDQRY